jgi:hypothetical protein
VYSPPSQQMKSPSSKLKRSRATAIQ